jgi:hypothetical protein
MSLREKQTCRWHRGTVEIAASSPLKIILAGCLIPALTYFPLFAAVKLGLQDAVFGGKVFSAPAALGLPSP